MGRKLQITRGMIIDSAFELLHKCGPEALTYRRIADAAGCSTQPVAWQFDSIENLKKELLVKVLRHLDEQTAPRQEDKDKNAVVKYYNLICRRLDFVIKETNLTDFLRTNGHSVPVEQILSSQSQKAMIEELSTELSLPIENVRELCTKLIIFGHGFYSLICTGALQISLEDAHRYMLENMLSQIVSYLPKNTPQSIHNLKQQYFS
ncbi:MAG: TetR/AcrR family transcriptional regulator [Bacteroidales bacterium]|nr:TetR/AcrR family transcriptional regulator [Bacteroidales bacterium]